VTGNIVCTGYENCLPSFVDYQLDDGLLLINLHIQDSHDKHVKMMIKINVKLNKSHITMKTKV